MLMSYSWHRYLPHWLQERQNTFLCSTPLLFHCFSVSTGARQAFLSIATHLMAVPGAVRRIYWLLTKGNLIQTAMFCSVWIEGAVSDFWKTLLKVVRTKRNNKLVANLQKGSMPTQDNRCWGCIVSATYMSNIDFAVSQNKDMLLL